MQSSYSRFIRYLFIAVWCAAAVPVAAAEPGAKSFMWEVRQGDRVIYLLGSLHVGNADFYPLSPAVEGAFAKSEVLAVEADVSDPQATMAAMQKGMYAGDDNVQNHLSKELVKRIAAVLPRYGMNMQLMANMKPFMLMSTLVMAESMRLGYDPQGGVDLYFLGKARARKMKIVELESIDAQLDIMNGFSDAEMEAMLGQTVASIEDDTMGKELKAMIAAWRRGDGAELLRVVEASFGEHSAAKTAVMEKLNARRNRAMTDKIERYLQSGRTHFVAVGALHLVGEQGIINLLRKKNYAITQR